MENETFAPVRSKCSIFHNIFKNLTFQRHPKERVKEDFYPYKLTLYSMIMPFDTICPFNSCFSQKSFPQDSQL